MILLKSLLPEIHDDEEFDVNKLNSVKDITSSILDKMAATAQVVYDGWVLNDEEYDEEVGYGGICHLVADDLIDTLYNNDIHNCQTVCSTHEQHVYVVGQFKEGVYMIDIPYHIYETGGGFRWKKKPNVKFDVNHIVVDKLDSDPENLEQYVDSM